MKILHTSDLHIGKRVREESLLEDQAFVLRQLTDIARREQPDAIILAGDIYDKSQPSAEAISLFDSFLTGLAGLGKAVFIISGNHDSAERIAFASRILENSRVYLSPVYDGNIRPVVLKDGQTEVAFYLLPFIKPPTVRHYAGEDAEISTFNDAMRHVIRQLDLDRNRRNVLVTHQYITGAERSESEDIAVGGLDNIDASVFSGFDYVALGHLHRPQYCGEEKVRYSGTPMKYSFSEVNDSKSVTLVEINGKDAVKITAVPLQPLHEWYDLRGNYDELTARDFYEGKGYREAYVRITLTDEEDVPDGMRKLRTIYHRLLELNYDNARTRAGMTLVGKPMDVSRLNPSGLFGELFEKQNAQPMNNQQREYLDTLIDRIFNK